MVCHVKICLSSLNALNNASLPFLLPLAVLRMLKLAFVTTGGIGPTRWSLPFYGGHIVRTPDNIVSVPHMTNGPATLPVFGPPCQFFGGPPAPCVNCNSSSEHTTNLVLDTPAPSASPRRRWSKKCEQRCGS